MTIVLMLVEATFFVSSRFRWVSWVVSPDAASPPLGPTARHRNSPLIRLYLGKSKFRAQRTQEVLTSVMLFAPVLLPSIRLLAHFHNS